MKLEDYLRLNNETQESFAARVGTSQSTISRLLPQDGRPPLRKPSFDLAERIARETGGLVTANDFMMLDTCELADLSDECALTDEQASAKVDAAEA